MTAPRPDPGAATHVEIGSGRWWLWSQTAVRSAGFPVTGVARLASPSLGRAADAVAVYAHGAPDPALLDEYARAVEQSSAYLRELAESPRFRTAVAWQNPRVVGSALDPLLRHRIGDRRNSSHRQREELLAAYCQRYCTKNDSIGHFGPVGWAYLDPARPTRYRAGSPLIAAHEVFFESWAIDRVAEVVTADPEIAEWLSPRRVPYLRVAAGAVLIAGRPAISVTPAVATLLAQCDGRRPARDIAGYLVEQGLADRADDVYAQLRELVKRRWLVWGLEIPTDPRPDRYLRSRLSDIGDAKLREPGLSALSRLDSARDTVDAAWNDPERLLPALHELDAVFIDITGTAATRNAGKTYGGRTVVYHDSRRSGELLIGAEVLAALTPIELVLDSAAWFTYTVGELFNAEVRKICRSLEQRLGRPVDLASLWFDCTTLVHRAGRQLAAGVAADLHDRWAKILRLPADTARVRLHAADLAPAVRDAFACPHAGWADARQVSPDFMLAAPSVAAIERGEFEVVLAEMHLALASYRHFCFVTQHPEPAELFACVDSDYPGPRLLQMLPKDNTARLTVRTQSALVRDEDYLVALIHQTVDPTRPRLLNSADLMVEERDGRLSVQVPSGDRYDVFDAFAELMVELVIDAFDVFPDTEAHLPRVTVDKLVVQRECWRFGAETLDFLHDRDPVRRYWRTRRWARDAGLPAKVFVSSPIEMKPFFLDFNSPIYVDIFGKAARRVQAAGSTRPLTLTEMLPGPDQLWLVDAAGEPYTCELRMVAVDRRPIDRSGAAAVPPSSLLPDR